MVVLVQETMGRCNSLIIESGKLFLGWGFFGVDVVDLSRGLITGISALCD